MTQITRLEKVTDSLFREGAGNPRNVDEDESKSNCPPIPSIDTLIPESSLIAETLYEEEYKRNKEARNEKWRQLQHEKAEIVLLRRELFDNEEITASAVQKRISSMFDKLHQRIEGRVTIMNIEHYRRSKLREVRLLQDDDSLQYLFEQLSRYITFNPNAMNEECDSNVFRTILCETTTFGDDYEIDEETIPKMVTKNEKYITALYDHLQRFYDNTDFAMDDEPDSGMTVGDVLAIIILYQRTFSTLKQRIMDSADEYVVDQDIFCKFVDPSFSVDAPSQKWSQRTKAAVNLYQSVLDHRENFVTLGQVRQTINMLILQLTEGMGAGKLSRLMNHIGKKINEQQQLEKPYVKNRAGKRTATQCTFNWNQTTQSEPVIDDLLQCEHIRGKQWITFVAEITNHFILNMKSRTVHENVHGMTLSDESAKDAQFEAILDMTHFDIGSTENAFETTDPTRASLGMFDTLLSDALLSPNKII